MMKGYLLSKGIPVSEHMLRTTLPSAAPGAHIQRQSDGLERANPHLYVARYFGHKLHVDQNEKMAMFGITYVLARDGYSGKIVGSSVMPAKNNLTIYEEVYRQLTLDYGLFDELRVDHGREFYLMLYVHEKLREHRGNNEVVAYRQTPSTQNHIIERMWVELNRRVSYPIKRVLIQMTESNMIDMNDGSCKYSVQLIGSNVAKIGMHLFISSWNAHSVPSRGIPNCLQQARSGTTTIHPLELPSTREAVEQYRGQGGNLTDPTPFVEDPLDGEDSLIQERSRRFLRAVPHGNDYQQLFSTLINGDSSMFCTAVTNFASITGDLAIS
jgi:hypothetical protein